MRRVSGAVVKLVHDGVGGKRGYPDKITGGAVQQLVVHNCVLITINYTNLLIYRIIPRH